MNINRIDPNERCSEEHFTTVKYIDKLLVNSENLIDLDRILLKDMRLVGSKFDELNISQDYLYHFPAFKRLIDCFEQNLPTLTKIVFLVGKRGKVDEINCIQEFIEDYCYQKTKDFHEYDRDVVCLKLLPLVSIVTGYSLGLLSSDRISSFHRFLSTSTFSHSFSSYSRIVDHLLFHKWEGRFNKLWKNLLPESMRTSSLNSTIRTNLLIKLGFLYYFPKKIIEWVGDEFASETGFELLIEKYKILGSLIYIEKFNGEVFEKHLFSTDLNEYKFLEFEHTSNFFDHELHILDEILKNERLERLYECGFKRIDSRKLKLFKQFYIELNFLQEHWCEIVYQSEFYKDVFQ